MVNTRIDTDLSAAVQNALQTLLPQIRVEIREEFRTSSGPSDAGGNPPPVANAARNYEILHERDDDDAERPDKRRCGSDNHRSSNNNYSGSNNRSFGNGRNQRNRGQQSNRYANFGSQQSRGPSKGYSYPVCTTCGRRHPGECRRAAGTYFKCGQAGHLQKDYKKNTTASTSGQDDKKPGASGRVFAITEVHAANTSEHHVLGSSFPSHTRSYGIQEERKMKKEEEILERE
nr:hypothetical protein [Tanacetum cinerariifolium]